MFKILWGILSLFLIIIIFLRMPQENIGLSSFANKSDIFGSPSSTQRTLNYITGISVFAYLLIAFNLNLNWMEQFFCIQFKWGYLYVYVVKNLIFVTKHNIGKNMRY